VTRRATFEFEIGSGTGIRTLNLAVNRSLSPRSENAVRIRGVALRTTNLHGLPPALLYETCSLDADHKWS
jgi:hypothetical protein